MTSVSSSPSSSPHATNESIHASPMPLQQQQQQRLLPNRFKTAIDSQLMSSSWLTSRILRNSDVFLPPRVTAPENNVNLLDGNDLNANPNNINYHDAHHLDNNHHHNDNVHANNFAANGDICLFHYPTTYLPKISVEEMGRAFELIAELGRTHDATDNQDDPGNIRVDNGRGVRLVQGKITNIDLQGDVQRYYINASQRARNQIARIQFNWYQFEEFPREVVGRTYGALRHVDIRQNSSLTCIESIIEQLPNLSSLNLSDCPNLRTLAPIARYASYDDNESQFTLNLNNNGHGDISDERPIRREPSNNQSQRSLNLRHLWIRGCNLSTMSKKEWSKVFDALSRSSGPLERMTLSRNRMRFLEGGIGKLESLSYLFVEDNCPASNDSLGDSEMRFELPMELGSLKNLRFLSLCGNNVTHLPRTMGRLNVNCDVHLQRNPNLVYPPAGHATSVKSMRQYFHQERMALVRGAILFLPHVKRSKFRANERLYCPGGSGYYVCKDRFEDAARKHSI
ncbi:hypothetical protein HJC23_006156 [Cyclotella cryptica]|uniref:L domain-like protein n=1 Tax=Cyclotella cryptica TaxID=29204 RepID=A0ABD3PBL9_9STRA|eukprot:CCRYP_016135-RA/>CCRYP_016135-RA protein AED:0.10 eAED:0.10 QI:510/1/1/1/1/1/3/78/510